MSKRKPGLVGQVHSTLGAETRGLELEVSQGG